MKSIDCDIIENTPKNLEINQILLRRYILRLSVNEVTPL